MLRIAHPAKMSPVMIRSASLLALAFAWTLGSGVACAQDSASEMLTRLDRLARSTAELLIIAERLRDQGAGLQSLDEPWADTISPSGRMVLTVFAGIAEFERALIRQRTEDGWRDARNLRAVEGQDAVFNYAASGGDQPLGANIAPIVRQTPARAGRPNWRRVGAPA